MSEIIRETVKATAMANPFDDPQHLANTADAMSRACGASHWQRSTAKYHAAVRDTLRAQAARITALEAELAAARRCPLCGGRTQEIAVKVKPLVWEDDSIPTRERAFASTEIGGYSVIKSHVTGVDYWVTVPGFSLQVEGDFEAAKAVAQADCERRILSAIEAVPVIAGEDGQ